MATDSTPVCSPRASRDAAAPSRYPPNQPPSRDASPHLDQTMRYPPPDALHLIASGKVRDAFLLTANARQIAASHALALCACVAIVIVSGAALLVGRLHS